MNIFVSSSGILMWNNKAFACALGKRGVVENKIEGDEATPLGCFPIREIMYRADRLTAPTTPFPVHVIRENDGWCDDVNDSNYNKKITLPYHASHEKLWREDNIYDVIVTLGYNDNPVIKSKGSAIFMHVARPNYTHTAGCIALSLPDMLEILKEASIETEVCVTP